MPGACGLQGSSPLSPMHLASTRPPAQAALICSALSKPSCGEQDGSAPEHWTQGAGRGPWAEDSLPPHASPGLRGAGSEKHRPETTPGVRVTREHPLFN